MGLEGTASSPDRELVFVTVRPPCQIEFGDLGVQGSQTRFTKIDFREGLFPKGKSVT